MKTIESVVYPLDCRHRTSFLICVIFVAFPILVSINAQKSEHGNTYAKKSEDNPEFSKNPKESKASPVRDENNDSMVKSIDDHRNAQSTKVIGENSPALNRFLEDVLKTQNDLKWIDQAVRNINHEKNWEKNNHRGSNLREKRGSDRSYENIWEMDKNRYRDENLQLPRGAYFDNDATFKRNADFDDLDVSRNGVNGKEVYHSPLYDKETADDQIPKDWTKTKDLCSLSDWLTSNKNSETEQDRSGDRWINDDKANKKNSLDFDKEANVKTDSRLNVRNQRDETKKEETPSLESLKETILELKKNLNEADKKQHENFNSVDARKVRGKENNKQDRGGRKTRARNKDGKNENDDETSSGWWENRNPETLDLKKREQGSEDLDEKNARLKVWRRKRTEVNNDDGNPKLFHRAGFGEQYLEENTLKELHDRKRRSKGTPSDEKRHLNEARDKNNLEADEKNSIKISKAASCNDVDTSSVKKESPSNDLQGTSAFEQASKPRNNLEDAANSKISNGQKEGHKNTEAVVNYEQSDLSRENLNAMENKLMKNEEKGESPEGNSLRTFESMTNELRAVSSTETSSLSTDGRVEAARAARMQKTEENQENVGSGKGEQVIKVFEPQGHLYQNSERTKEVRRTEPDEERGKLSRQLVQEKTPPKESENINILLKSENKNLIKFSNGYAGKSSPKDKDERPPFVLNMFDVKKKMILENEDKPGESVSSVYNMKYEKAQVDTPVKPTNKREEDRRNDDVPFDNGLPDFGKNKVKEVLYEDTPGSANNAKQRNVDETRLKNFIEFDKGSEQSGVNERGIRNWFEGVVRNQMGTNVDQGTAEKCNELDEKDKPKNEEERFNDYKDKQDFTQDSNNKAALSDPNDGKKNNKKNHEIFIMTNGMDDGIINDRYGHRRILQYMEYSNDDVEDADQNYSDKEEDDNQQQSSAEKSNPSTRRKERSAYSDKKKAKVNLLIKEKMAKKKKPDRGRKRRNPNVIEYYDYDTDIEQQDHEALSPTSEQERSKNNYQDKNAVESDAGLAENEESSQTCMPLFEKKDEHEEAILKEEQRKEKLKNKAPKQEFLSPGVLIKNETEKTVQPISSSVLPTNVKFTEQEGSSSNQQPGSRLNEPIERNEEKFLDNDAKGMILDPAKYILKVDKNLDLGAMDEFLEDIQSMDEKKQKVSNNMEPLYEEMKKIYDWNEDETKSKPRVKGDQRMYYGANDKLDPIDRMTESFKDQVEPASSPNLLPLLLVYNGSGKSEIGDRTYPAVSSGQLKSPAESNVSQSNYFALKSTDDMFKGGSEQSNSTEEKLRGPSTIGTAAEWQTQKVNGVKNGAVPEKDAVSWSLTDQRQYIDTDSRSPYENRKYLEPQFPRGREHVQNIDREKQTVISSKDLHESFVEPLEWIDDFDKDIRVRLGRSLKTVETNTIAYVKYDTPMHDKSLVNGSVENVQPMDSAILKSDQPKVALTTYPLDVQRLFQNNVRVKRDAAFPYDTYYDDVNQRHRDSEKMDYSRYSNNEEKMNNNLQLLNSYEDTDDTHRKLSISNKELEEYDSLEDDDDDDDDDEVARIANSKSKRHGNKKKHYEKALKKQKRKGHVGKSNKSRRKRRHHKKHSNDSKTKKRNKKHKKGASKRTSHHTNVKKSKASQNEEKVRGEKKEHRDKVKKEDTNSDTDAQGRKISSLLTADNMEDESQIDSALHGELAGKIVEQIFDQVQKNEVLKVSLGPGLYQKHKTRDTVAADKSYRQTLNDDEIKHTEELLNRIMLLLNRLIFDEVQRKTCISLPPDLIEFLDWMLDVNPQENLIEQPPTLPFIHEGGAQDFFPQDKFLFKSFPNEEMEAEINELYVKIRLIKSLIKEYSALTEKDKAKIESIQDYLAKQLDLLLEYIEAKEEAEKKGKSSSPIGTAKGKAGGILRYQVGTSNASNGSYSTRPDTFSPLMNAPNLLKLSNTNFLTDEELFREDNTDVRDRGQRIIRSLNKHTKHTKHNKKQRKRKKRKRKHGKHYKGASTIDQSRHKDTVHKAAALRPKREYLDRVFWDSFNSEYEEPLVYSSMDMTNVKSNGNGDSALKKEENLQHKGDENAQSWQGNTTSDIKKDSTVDVEKSIKIERGTSTSVSNIQSREQINFNKNKDPLEEEEPITGKNQLEDEILLLNKRQAWKQKNEQQLEEVAFGEDMRKASKDKELFEKLTEIDKEKNQLEKIDTKNSNLKDYTANSRNNNYNLSNEDKLRMLEEKINVYADNE